MKKPLTSEHKQNISTSLRGKKRKRNLAIAGGAIAGIGLLGIGALGLKTIGSQRQRILNLSSKLSDAEKNRVLQLQTLAKKRSQAQQTRQKLYTIQQKLEEKEGKKYVGSIQDQVRHTSEVLSGKAPGSKAYAARKRKELKSSIKSVYGDRKTNLKYSRLMGDSLLMFESRRPL